jgi:hypothetical protein
VGGTTRRRRLGALVAAIGLASGAFVAAPAGARAPSPPTITGSQLGDLVVDPTTGVVVAAVDDRLEVFDADATHLTTIVGLVGAGGLAVDGNDLWVTTQGAIARVDLDALAVAQTFPVAFTVGRSVAVVGDRVWFVADNQLAVLNPATGSVSRRGGSFPASRVEPIPGDDERVLVYGTASGAYRVRRVDVTTTPVTIEAATPVTTVLGEGRDLRDVAATSHGTFLTAAEATPGSFDETRGIFTEWDLDAMDISGLVYGEGWDPSAVDHVEADGGLVAVTFDGDNPTADSTMHVERDGSPYHDNVATIDVDGVIPDRGAALAPDGATAYALVAPHGSTGTWLLTAHALDLRQTVVDSVEPSSGPPTGGTDVVLRGSGFLDADAVVFGGRRAEFTVVDDHEIRAEVPVSPFSATSTMEVSVQGFRHWSRPSMDALFRYTGPTPAPDAVPRRPAAVFNTVRPRDVAVDAVTGNVIVSGLDEVRVFDPTGQPVHIWTDVFGAWGVDVEGRDLWVVETEVGHLRRYDLDTFALEQTVNTRLGLPGSVAVIDGGVWFLAEGQIHTRLHRLDPATGEIDDRGVEVDNGVIEEIPGSTSHALIHTTGLRPYSVHRIDLRSDPAVDEWSIPPYQGNFAAQVAATDHRTFVVAAGAPRQALEFGLDSMRQTGVRYEGGHTGPRAVVWSAVGGGIHLVTGQRTTDSTNAFVFRDGVTTPVHEFSAVGMLQVRGAALSPAADAAYVVTQAADRGFALTVEPLDLTTQDPPPAPTPDLPVFPRSIDAPGNRIPIAGYFFGGYLPAIVWHSPRGVDRAWINNGLQFGLRAVPNQQGAVRTAVGDFDGDRHDEILWYRPGVGRDEVWRTTASRIIRLRTAMGGHHRPLAGDFDGDGDDDVLWFTPGAAHNPLWSATGRAVNAFRTRQVPGAPTGATGVTGDFDDDLDDDVAWFGPGGAIVGIWEADGVGRFVHHDTTFSTRGRVVAADVTGDGASDIVVVGTGPDTVVTGHAIDALEALTVDFTASAVRPVRVDVTGDAADDLLLYDPSPGPDQILRFVP